LTDDAGSKSNNPMVGILSYMKKEEIPFEDAPKILFEAIKACYGVMKTVDGDEFAQEKYSQDIKAFQQIMSALLYPKDNLTP
jgi:hypothetical protein